MSKLRFEKERRKTPIKNLGYYIALGLCLSAVGIAGWTALGKNNAKIKNDPDDVAVQSEYISEDWDTIAKKVDAVVSGVPKEEDVESVEEAAVVPEPKVSSSEPSSSEAVSSEEEKILYTLPVTGKIHKNFSGTELLYSQTLEDWRVHEGVDITAAKGDKVKTAAAGEVIDVLDDALYGTTVIIRHNDGLTVYYCGLSPKTLVEKGAKIESGTVLGTIDSVPCEIADPPHLHLAAKKDGAWVDPIAAMGLKIS